MELTVREIRPNEDGRLISFLDKTGASNSAILGYHYPFYRDMLQTAGIGQPYYLGCFHGEELVAVLPGFLKEGVIGTTYNSLPFFGPNSGVLCDFANETLAEAAYEVVFSYLDEHLKNMNTATAAFYTPFKNHSFDNLEKYLGNVVTVEKFTNYLDLSEAEWSYKIMYDIRKAEKAGVRIETEVTDSRIEELYAIYEKNCEDYGIPLKPFKAVEYLVLEAAKGNTNTGTYFAYMGEEMIGALIMIYGPSTASYYLPCSKHEHRSLQPTTLLINHAVNVAREKGIRYWNWESSPSKDSGVFQFKKKWGSEEDYYFINIKLYVSEDRLTELSPAEISQSYPFFFVYPFNRLQPVAESL